MTKEMTTNTLCFGKDLVCKMYTNQQLKVHMISNSLFLDLKKPCKRLYSKRYKSMLRGSCKKFCHWVRITSVLRFIKRIFITNLQSIPPLLKHSFVTFLPSREKQINSLLLVSVGNTDK